MLEPLLSLASLALMNLAAFALGRPLLRRFRLAEEDRLATLVWSLMLGWLALGLALAGLGLLGWLHRGAIGIATLALGLAGIYQLGGLRGWRRSLGAASNAESEATAGCPPPPPAIALWLLAALAGVAVLGSLASALAPPTAGDALCYHLELPKRFLLEHRLYFSPYDDNCTFPLLTEMWYLWGLAVNGAVAAQLVHWELGLVLAAAGVLLARPVLGHRWAWMAGAVVLLVPGVNNQMTAPLTDVALAAWVALALAAWWRAVMEETAQQRRRWFLLAGVAAGGALSTKYVALLMVAALGLVWLGLLWRRPGQRRALLRGAAIMAAAALLVAGVWYARAAWYRHNPLFPYFSDTLAAADSDVAAATTTLPAAKSPLGRSPLKLLLSPWYVSLFPERLGGRAHQLGVLFLAALPGLLFCRRLRGLGLLLAVAACYWVVWFLLRQNVRFLLPIVPVLAIAAVWVAVEVGRFPPLPRRIIGVVTAGLLLLMAAAPLWRCRGQLAVATGLESRTHYLLGHEPSYAVALRANALLRPDARILSQDLRNFYIQRRVTRESIFRRTTHYAQRVTDPGDLSRVLRAEGFSHLLLAETLAGSGIDFDPTLRRLADAQSQADPERLVSMGSYDFRESDGTVRRYRLMLLR